MRFILLNGRMPRPQAFCVMCDQPIGASYLREIGTHLIYCDHDCYADHCESAFLLLEPGKSIMNLLAYEKELPTISAERLPTRSRRKGHLR